VSLKERRLEGAAKVCLCGVIWFSAWCKELWESGYWLRACDSGVVGVCYAWDGPLWMTITLVLYVVL